MLASGAVLTCWVGYWGIVVARALSTVIILGTVIIRVVAVLVVVWAACWSLIIAVLVIVIWTACYWSLIVVAILVVGVLVSTISLVIVTFIQNWSYNK